MRQGRGRLVKLARLVEVAIESILKRPHRLSTTIPGINRIIQRWFLLIFYGYRKWTHIIRWLVILVFFGYAWRLASGVSGDVGADYVLFTRTHDYDYPEVYLGFASGIWSGRLYYAPRYFGRDYDAVYGEINAAQPLSERFRIFAHGGVLWSKSGNPYDGSDDRATFDARIGLGFDLDRFSLELSWVGVSNARSAYPFASNGRRNGPVVALTLPF